jgi:mannose-6-phosphate isomerase-like protein (cupin superfamily)
MIVVDGRVQVDSAEDSLEAGPGTMVRFEEKERRRVSSPEGAKLLLILAPWPGPGHYRGDPERAAG